MIQRFYHLENVEGKRLRTNGRSGRHQLKSWTEPLSMQAMYDTRERAEADRFKYGGTIVEQDHEVFYI